MDYILFHCPVQDGICFLNGIRGAGCAGFFDHAPQLPQNPVVDEFFSFRLPQGFFC